MKKRWMMAAVLGLALMAAGCSEDKNPKTTESTTETTAETTTESQSETESGGVSQLDRPDYKALDYVTLGEYKGLPVTLASLAVTDEQIDSEISAALSQNDKLETLTEGTVENGDIANIDYEGVKDGVAFEGGTDKGFDLTIGSGTFIEGFEEGLVGKKVGESVDLNLTFPENYGNTDLAGQEVVFHVTINSIKRAPEFTDELAAELSDNAYSNVADYRANVKETLTAQNKTMQDNQKINDLMTQLYNNSTINDYPAELVEFQKQQYMDYYTTYAEQSDMSLEDFIQQNFGVSMDEFNTQMEETAKQGLRQELLLKAIVETEGLTLEEGEYEKRAQEYVNQMGFADIAALEEQYGQKLVETNMLLDKALELVEENAVVTDPDAPAADGETETDTESETAAE